MDTAFFRYPDEFLGTDGADQLSRISDRSGCNRITVTAAYHTARDLPPHGRSGRIKYLDGGTTYFQASSGGLNLGATGTGRVE